MLVVYTLIFIIIFYLHQQWKNRHIYEMGRRLNSGLRSLPILGHGYLFIGNNETRMKTFQDVGRDALKHKNGLTALWLGSNLYTVVADPVAAEFITKFSHEKDSVMDVTRLHFEMSILAPGGWKPRRKILTHCFTPTNVKKFFPIFIKNNKVLIQQLDKVAGKGTISIWKYLTSFTMDNASETTLGYEVHAQNDSVHPFLTALDINLQSIAKRVCSPWLYSDLIYCNLPATKKALRMARYISQFLLKLIISKRKEILHRNSNGNINLPMEKDYSTFLEMLIQTSKDSKSYTNMEIKEDLLLILVAGIDTSAVASSFTCLMLSRYPDVQQKVCEELQDVFGNSDRTPTLDDLVHLKYLEAVIKETLRLYTPGPLIARQINKDLILPSDFKIVSGTGAIINIWAIHRNRHYWGEDAEQFRPERFIDTPLKHPAAFIPFGLGPRNCTGYQYAMMSMKLAISTILRNFKILPPNDLPCSEQPPIRLQYDLMMKDVDKFQVKLEHRR